MPKAPPPSVLLKFQGYRAWPPEQENDDWGLTPAQQESYVEQFRRLLSSKNAWKEDHHDYYVLRRFLRARSYDLEKATEMWMAHLAWVQQFRVETILQEFYFDERDKFLTAYPQGYHKIDKMGRPIYIQLIGKVDINTLKKITTEERMVKFHIQEYERCGKVILPICSHLAGRNIDQTFGIMDVKGVGLSHLTGEVRRLLGTITKYDQDNYPEMLGHICIINAPGMFRMLWNVVKGMLDPRTQSKIEILDSNYMPGLLKWVDIDSIPDWLGGRSKGTLSDDVGPWSDMELVARLNLDVEVLRQGHRPPQHPVMVMGSSGAHAAAAAGGMPSLPSMRRDGGSAVQSLDGGAGLGGGVPSLRRPSDLSEAFQSPNTSGDFSAFRNSLRLPGMQEHASVGMPAGRSPGSSYEQHVVSGAGMNGTTASGAATAAAGVGGFAAIPEVAPSNASVVGGPGMTLVQRIAALESTVPGVSARLRAAGLAAGHTAGGSVSLPQTTYAGEGASSTRSAPQGSLLYRVEVLEEAVGAMLAAQQAALQYQQQLLAQQQGGGAAGRDEPARQAATKEWSCCGCCVVM